MIKGKCGDLRAEALPGLILRVSSLLKFAIILVLQQEILWHIS